MVKKQMILCVMAHPLDQFRYCPRCASPQFVVHNEKAKRCLQCGFVYYFNACSATAAFLLNACGELLVARRGKEPARGSFDLPGGFVDSGESAEEGIMREVYEETGLHPQGLRYLFSLPNIYPYSGFEVHTLDMFFVGRIENGPRPEAHDDVAETLLIPVSRIDPADFGLRSVRLAVERFKADYERGAICVDLG